MHKVEIKLGMWGANVAVIVDSILWSILLHNSDIPVNKTAIWPCGWALFIEQWYNQNSLLMYHLQMQGTSNDKDYLGKDSFTC